MAEITSPAGAATDTTTAAGATTQQSAAATGADDKGTIIAPESKATDEASKTADEKAKAEADAKAKAEADAKAKAESAPEKYDFKPPEGVAFAPEALSKFEALARENNMTQANADAFLALAADHVRAQQQAVDDAYEKEIQGWAKASREDAEVGGKDFDSNVKLAQRALDEIGTPELRTLVNKTGIGNHPEMVRLFARIGRAMADGKFVQGGAADSAPKPLEKRMYPNMN